MKIKNILLTGAMVIGISISAFAQRFAYVDSEYILNSMPEYTAAQKQLDAISVKWQEEVDSRFAEIEKMYQAYQNDQVVMTEEMRRNREDAILQKEREAKDFQRQKFGYEGDLFKERERLIAPIQEKVSKAVQALAESQNLDVIFDKNSEVTMLFANPRLDKSDEVITRMGYKPQARNN